MTKRQFRVGDKVRVTGMSPVTFAPGVKDELGTEKLFKSMLGKVYTVRGFDKIGNIELEPKRLNTVWIEPESLKLRSRKRKSRRRTLKPTLYASISLASISLDVRFADKPGSHKVECAHGCSVPVIRFRERRPFDVFD